MTSTSAMTVGQIAAERPAAIPIFEKYDIDYCCGGNQPIADVAEQRGIAVEKLLSEVESAGTSDAAAEERDWTHAPLRELIQNIVGKHHAYLRSELPLLEAMIAKVVEVHTRRHSDTLFPLRRFFHQFRQGLEGHTRKEEAVLFPAILRVEEARTNRRPAPRFVFGSLSNLLASMEQEHETAGWELAEMREITGNYNAPPDACSTYRALFERLQALEADMHRHVHLENNILFPRVAQLEQDLL